LQETENLSKQLRERQKLVKEQHEDNLVQIKMFKDLRKVLACKMRVLNEEMSDVQTTSTGGNQLVL
jgi:intraflagellar transport protein 81